MNSLYISQVAKQILTQLNNQVQKHLHFNMKTHFCFVLAILVVQLASSAIAFPSSSPYTVRYSQDDLQSDDRITELFKKWCSINSKSYISKDEEAQRFKIFKDNLMYIDSHKDQNLGLNGLADLTHEEFKSLYTTELPDSPGSLELETYNSSHSPASCSAPSAIDWRQKGAVTPVKNQLKCGSCWSFPVVGAIEGINKITTGNLISLSEQQLIDCVNANSGCKGGWPSNAYKWFIKNRGIDTEVDYPYMGVASVCKKRTRAVRISGYSRVASTDAALRCAVAQQPISVIIDAHPRDFHLYPGGIYDGSCSTNPNKRNHVVLIVGYGTYNGVDYWTVKNSWGPNWGDNGYIYIKRNTRLQWGKCSINSAPLYPRMSSSQVFCGGNTYCQAGQSCCCVNGQGNTCYSFGCCKFPNTVCCPGGSMYCPYNYPVCNVYRRMCYQRAGDIVGLDMSMPSMSKIKDSEIGQSLKFGHDIQ